MFYNGFAKKTVWITGASKGIGRAIAEDLIAEDCVLILSASSENSFFDCNFEKENVVILPFDLSNDSDVSQAVNFLKNKSLHPDIVINNAGVGIFKSFKSLSLEDFDRMNNVNYRSAFAIIKEVLPQMLEAKFGVIANVLSIAATTNFPRSSVYGASKSALLEMMKTLRLEVRNDGIKVINFLPGATETSIWSPKVIDEFGSKMMKPSELAKAILSTINISLMNNLTFEEVVIRPTTGDL